jgi:type I restriction-modification system DNA methylase subunit
MPFAANVAACHLALQSPQYFTNKVNVAIWDSTELLPGKTIPSIASLRFVLKGQTGLEMFTEPKREDKGVVSLTGEIPEEIKLEAYDVVIMNPPFTRHERMPKDYKGVLFDRFKDYKQFLHGQMGYFGYFILLADRFLKESGKMALVLPATALHIRSSEGIRRLWSENYHVEYLITTWHRLAFSESVVFREILLVAKKTKPNLNMQTKICVLKKLPSKISQAREIAEKIKAIKQDWEDDDLAMKIHSYSKLTADTTDWHRLISLSDLKLVDFLEGTLSSKN